MTILEALVAMTVLSLLMTSIYLLLIYGLHSRRQSEVYQTVHHQAEIAMQKLSVELTDSTIPTVSYGATPPHIIFLSLQKTLDQPDRSVYTFAPSGSAQWHKWVCFYLDESEHNLIRSEIDLGGPITLPPTPSPPVLSDFQTSPSARTVARNIVSLEFVPGAGLQTLSLSLTAEAMVNSDKATSITLNSEVRVRN